MKTIHILTISALAALLLTACGNQEAQLRQRAAELCRYIPDHQLQPGSQDYMTADFYAVLDTMFNHLPEHEAMDHEWLYYFVTGNGGTIADYDVTDVSLTDPTHAVATIQVRQQWEDGSFDETTDIEEHQLYMEKERGKWLMADFDGHKQDCQRHIDINHKEQAVRDAIADYLVREVGTHYLQGQLCIPTLMIVAEEESDDEAHVWCDSWVEWYNISDDTLKTVSGGNHSGLITLRRQAGKPSVTAFEQTLDGAAFLPSAKRIFGSHYDIFQNIHSNQDVREAVRQEQLQEYVRRHNLDIRYYQDYGWPAVPLTPTE